MRLIDADELQQIFNETSTALMREPKLLKDIEHMVRAFLMTTEMIKDAPTIEAEPVKHGRWIIGQCGKDKYIKCSVCKARIVDTIVSLEGDISQDYFVICPRCGARMDGDKT